MGARDLDAGLRGGTSADPGVGKEAGARGSSARLTGERMQRLLLWIRWDGSEMQQQGSDATAGSNDLAGRRT